MEHIMVSNPVKHTEKNNLILSTLTYIPAGNVCLVKQLIQATLPVLQLHRIPAYFCPVVFWAFQFQYDLNDKLVAGMGGSGLVVFCLIVADIMLI